MSQCTDCGATLPTHKLGCHDGAKAGLVYRLRREGTDAMTKHYSLGMWQICAEAADEIERLRAALIQVRGFAQAMNENNWRDLRLHIERQTDCLLEQTGDKT